MKWVLLILALMFNAASVAFGAEGDALSISRNIQERHLPFGTILDPIFDSPEGEEIVGYTRAGDSAIWTGHYLAAEAFRHRVTGEAEALENVKKALTGIRLLVDATGYNLLARCVLPGDSPYTPAILEEEKSHGIYPVDLGGKRYYWIGRTTRDQYSGVFFGLGVAYDLVEDSGVRADAARLVTRMLNFLLDHQWFVVMPDGSISTAFSLNPDKRLSLLSVGRHVNPDRFNSDYKWERFFHSAAVGLPIAYDVLDDHNSYYKFNLDTISLYHLIRLEGNKSYRKQFTAAYDLLRRTTDDHGNAHFNMIDRALKGANDRRDQETRDLLEQWLQRPRRDGGVDWRGDPRYPTCDEDKSCWPISIADRVRTDFLWQRSPFLLYGGGWGTIETAGIDYILPYWMGRYYGVIRN